jgi:hypothetical protein
MNSLTKPFKLSLYGLAFFWIFDGLCQFQSKLLTKQFISAVVQPNFLAYPGFLTNLTNQLSRIFLLNPVLFGSMIGLTQILIGGLIIFRSTRTIGLYMSLLWGLFVWVFGENMANIFSGNFNVFSGFPGNALIYVILSGILIICLKKSIDQTDYFGLGLKLLWFLFWIFSALGLMLPSFGGYQGLKNVYLMNQFKLPLWLNNIDQLFHNLIVYLGPNALFELVVLEIIIAMIVFVNNQVIFKIGLAVALILLSLIWLIGQMAGMYFSGVMTDPNTALTMILVLGAIYYSPIEKIQDYYGRLEKLLT